MKIGDVIIIIVLVTASVFIGYLTLTSDALDSQNTYLVSYENEIILELNVHEKDEGVFPFQFGHYEGAVQVKDKKIRILPMSKNICPKQLCSRFGWASRPGDILVCLPNELVVQVIKSKGDENYGADTVSF